MTIFVGLCRGFWRYWDIPLAMEQQVVKTMENEIETALCGFGMVGFMI